MSNDINVNERLYKQQAAVNKMVLDGVRHPGVVSALPQSIIDAGAVLAPEPQKFAPMRNSRGEPVEFSVIVPADYDHSKTLARFAKANKRKCYYFNPNLTGKNFSNPSRVLKAGDRLRLRPIEQIVHGPATSSERMDFLRNQPGNVFVGAQGLPLIFDRRDELPKGKCYSSFDEPERLPFLEGYHMVPYVYAYDGGDFDARLGSFEGVSYQDRAFFCFSESLVA